MGVLICIFIIFLTSDSFFCLPNISNSRHIAGAIKANQTSMTLFKVKFFTKCTLLELFLPRIWYVWAIHLNSCFSRFFLLKIVLFGWVAIIIFYEFGDILINGFQVLTEIDGSDQTIQYFVEKGISAPISFYLVDNPSIQTQTYIISKSFSKYSFTDFSLLLIFDIAKMTWLICCDLAVPNIIVFFYCIIP